MIIALANYIRSRAQEQCDAIDDATQVYGIDTPCDLSPIDQCEFNAVGIEPDRCVHCGRKTG